MTLKEIRNKMYLWAQANGVRLDDQDRQEIKTIMNEYGQAFLEEKLAQKTYRVPVTALDKPATTSNAWKPYEG